MAEFQGRHPLNVPGKYYVDYQCLDCDACRATAPDLFLRDESRGAYYVARQPVTAEEIELAHEALEGCPCEAIGNNGDECDWQNTPLDPSWDSPVMQQESVEKRTCCCNHDSREDHPPPPQPKRPWWRFW